MKPILNMLVLYKSQPAIICGFEGDKIEIDTQNGIKKVREKDIDVLHTGPVKKLAAVFDATLPEGSIPEAYDFFAGETPLFSDIAELVWGALLPEQVWVAWSAISSSPWFVATVPLEPVRLRTKEEAEAIIKKADIKRGEETEREAFRARLSATLKAARKHEAAGEGGVDPVTDGKFLQDVEALALGKTDKSRTLKDSGIPETPQEAHRVLLSTEYWPLWKNPWPSRHGHTVSSSSVEVEAPTDSGERLDLTSLDAWAIDNEWSCDPDDAVSVEGDTLWVHIADPAATVTPDSKADKDARGRGSTLYIPEGASRMLEDRALEYYALGLSPVSNALSFGITFTDSGAVEDVTIRLTRIRVTRLTYAEAGKRKEEPSLARLFAIAERNIGRRRAAGAVFIDLPEIHISVTMGAGNKPEVTFHRIEAEKAADMVREMMLLAGEATARFAFKNKIPFQYVSQETPEIPADLPSGLAGEYRKRRFMKSRKVGTIPSDHAGLGLGMYSQVTSPLRRYGDLVAHQQLRLFLSGKPVMDTDDMLARIAQGDSASRQCTLAERASNLHWVLYYLSVHPEWTGEAIVVENNGSQATILVPEFAQEARIPSPGSAEPGTVIRVKAGNINIPEQSVSYIPQ